MTTKNTKDTSQNTGTELKKIPLVPLKKLLGLYIHLNTNTSFMYGSEKIKLNAFGGPLFMKITEDLDIFEIEEGVRLKLMYIADEKSVDISVKFYPKYKPVTLHIWKDPRAIDADPKSAALSVLVEDSTSLEHFLRVLEKASKETLELLYNLFKTIPKENQAYKMKLRALERRMDGQKEK